MERWREIAAPDAIGRSIIAKEWRLEDEPEVVLRPVGVVDGFEWPNNVLRHSFISYRIAIVKSAEQVALEAGNSPTIIFKHYRELATEEQADEWFGIFPLPPVLSAF